MQRLAQKFLAFTAVVLLSACSSGSPANDWVGRLATGEPAGTKYVDVRGHSWAVFPVKGQPSVFGAQRDNLNYNLYGAPPYRRAPQAIQAIELATGCRVRRDDLAEFITARFYASVVCN